MTDSEFMGSFEDGTLPGSVFHHQDHVRLAWLYLARYPALEALARFAEGLKRFAAAQGHAGLYHETITWAYLFLIQERRAATGAETWEEFAARNPDLLGWNPSVLDRYYDRETLFSDRARQVFVMPVQFERQEEALTPAPDRCPGPAPRAVAARTRSSRG